MESALIITPFSARAISMAMADLPLAVGPAISTTRFGRLLGIMDSVVVLIAAHGSGAITSDMGQSLTANGWPRATLWKLLAQMRQRHERCAQGFPLTSTVCQSFIAAKNFCWRIWIQP